MALKTTGTTNTEQDKLLLNKHVSLITWLQIAELWHRCDILSGLLALCSVTMDPTKYIAQISCESTFVSARRTVQLSLSPSLSLSLPLSLSLSLSLYHSLYPSLSAASSRVLLKRYNLQLHIILRAPRSENKFSLSRFALTREPRRVHTLQNTFVH